MSRKTPQQTAHAWQSALVEGRWDDALACLTADSRSALVASCYFAAAHVADPDAASGIALDELLGRHGFKETKAKKWSVQDLVAAFGDLMAWSATHAPDGKGLDLVEKIARTTYSEFRIDGEFAYAIATTDGRRSQTQFRLVGGRWYMS